MIKIPDQNIASDIIDDKGIILHYCKVCVAVPDDYNTRYCDVGGLKFSILGPVYMLPVVPANVVAYTNENAFDHNVLKFCFGKNWTSVPTLGCRVQAVIRNEKRSGRVEGYLIENGYLGLCVKLDEVPAWHQDPHKIVHDFKTGQDIPFKQSFHYGYGLVFGNDCKPEH
jgi:hypothetical protein